MTEKQIKSATANLSPYIGKAMFTGRTHSPETRKKLSDSHKKLWRNPEYREKLTNSHIGYKFPLKQRINHKKSLPRSENHHAWTGDNPEYRTLHMWVRRLLGAPKVCSYCGGDEKRIEWASISHKAKRDLKDYVALCHQCHKKYDSKGGLAL